MNLKLLFFLLLLALAGTALGDTLLHCTPAGAILGGQPVGACAAFTTAADQLFVNLINTVDNPVSAAQGINGFRFVLEDALTATALTSSSAMSIDIASDGTFAASGLLATGWLLSGDGLGACALCPGAIGPAGLVLGAPGASGEYDNANGSIAGNGPHNPFRNGEAQFVFTVPGMTEDSVVLGSTVYFSTLAGQGVPTDYVPEPATLALIGISLLALGALRRRRLNG